ncbi:MAG: hypothetical protein LAN59_04355 [Acidobacteriia bacterium]|nr:hypothetical protein [Terriglobia bacterium]
MNRETMLVELMLAGFFAVACIRSWVPAAPTQKVRWGSLFRFPGRLERLRRSRWQWFSMVAFLLVIRLQRGAPLVLEVMVALQFLIFVALPTWTQAQERVPSK